MGKEIEPVDISKIELPAFADRSNLKPITIDGEEGVSLQQAIPANLRRKDHRVFVPSVRKPTKLAMRNARAGTKMLAEKTWVKEDDTIEIQGGNGERVFFRVIRSGYFSCRYFDVRGYRRVVIDNFPGAAVLAPDHELYLGFREVKNGR